MGTFKKTKVVMLPTNEKAIVGSIVTRPSDNRMATVNVLTINDPQPCVHQHLYFLSDEEIKEGDWVCNGTEIWQVNSYYGFQAITKKIISTTDNSLEKICEYESGTWLRLPQPSTSFIEKFVEEYNKGNIITEVSVEYETITKRYGSCSIGEGVTMNVEQLKVNPKDNTITIRKAKDSWNRDEVMKFGNWCRIHDSKFPNQVWTIQQLFDKWIQENL